MDPPLLSRKEFERVFNPVFQQHLAIPGHSQHDRPSYEDYIKDMTFMGTTTSINVHLSQQISLANADEPEKDRADADTHAATVTQKGRMRRNHRGKRKPQRNTDGPADDVGEAVREQLQDLGFADSGTREQSRSPPPTQISHIQKLHNCLSIHALLLPRLNTLPVTEDATEIAKLHGCLGSCEKHLHTLLRAATDTASVEEERLRELCVDVLERVAACVMKRERIGDHVGDDGGDAEDEEVDSDGGVAVDVTAEYKGNYDKVQAEAYRRCQKWIEEENGDEVRKQ